MDHTQNAKQIVIGTKLSTMDNLSGICGCIFSPLRDPQLDAYQKQLYKSAHEFLFLLTLFLYKLPINRRWTTVGLVC